MAPTAGRGFRHFRGPHHNPRPPAAGGGPRTGLGRLSHAWRGRGGESPAPRPLRRGSGSRRQGKRFPGPAARRRQAASGAPRRRHHCSPSRATRFRPARPLWALRQALRGGSGPARPAPLPAPPGRTLLSGCPWRRGAEALPAGRAWLQKSLAPCWAMPRRTRTRELRKINDPKLRLDSNQASWFGSVVTLGAAAGGILGGYLVDKVGRKLSLMLCSLPYIFGYLVVISAQNVWMLYFGRMLSGLASGITSLVVPVYISEVSHPKVRGMLGSCVQLMVVTGILGAYIAGIQLRWQWLAVLGSVPPCMMVLLMSFMPETPRFLLSHNQLSEAVAALRFLRGPQADHEWECQQIEAGVQEEELKLSEFKNPSIYKPLLIGVALMFFQQVTGINAVMFYAETIFEDANFKDSRMASVVVGSIQVCFTAVAALIIDKTGRKVLLYISGIIMALSTALFGLYFKVVLPNGNNASNPDVWFTLNAASPGTESSMSWLAVVSLGLFVAGFALGWGPIPWLVISEIFPLKARGISSAACVLTNWIMAFLVTKEFQDLLAFLTSYGTFWLFSALCCLNVTFTAFYVPETKGQTLEQIEAYFRRF